jgi:hypothetical protein
MLVVPPRVLADVEGVIRYAAEQLTTIEGEKPILNPVKDAAVRTAALNALSSVISDMVWPGDERLVTIDRHGAVAAVMPVTGGGKAA